MNITIPGTRSWEFYQGIVGRRNNWKLLEELEVPAAKGLAFVVREGQVFSVFESRGPQCADINIFNLRNPKERFSAERTRISESAHPSVGARLWTIPNPYPRILMTIIEDHSPPLSHDLLFGGGGWAGCSVMVWEWVTGAKNHANCNDNLIAAIQPFGLGAENVHHVLNLFMKTGVDPITGKLFFGRTDAKVGDYVTFYVEMDCLVAVSACPCGPGPHTLSAKPLPLGIRIYEVGSAAT